MKTKKLNKILSAAFVFSALFFVLTLFVSNSAAAKQKSSDSALLNPKYKDKISSFLIQKEDEEISVEKQGAFYLVKKSGTTSFADSKIAETLIENFSKIRKIYKIDSNNSESVKKNRQSGNKNNFISYDDVQKNIQLDDNIAKNQTSSENNVREITRIIFYDSTGNEVSDVEFSSQNHLLGRIEFLSGEKLYETEDDFSQFLTTDFNYWSDGSLFPEIKNPVKITYSLFNASQEPKAMGKPESNDFFKVLSATDSDENFARISSGVLSLRHGNLSDKDFADDTAALYSKLEVEDGGGRVSTIIFKKIENPEYFICSKTISPSPVESDEDKAALSSQNAVFELSKWTVEGIEKLF